MSELSIVTVNIEYGNRNYNKIKERTDLITKNNPDFIFIQECEIECIKLNNYTIVQFPHNKVELVEIFIKNDSLWEIYFTEQFNSTYSYTTRACRIIYVKHKYTNKIMKLANIHLCGGRYDENDYIGGMLVGSINDIHNRKLEILRELVDKYNIDIIAGDFNSDINCYKYNKVATEQLKFFKNISPKTKYKIFEEWNKCPYIYLKNNNYTLSSKTKGYTSIYKTHPDSIWYKNCNEKQMSYIDLITKYLSDHNGIYSLFIC
jgi:hypothetical protein